MEGEGVMLDTLKIARAKIAGNLYTYIKTPRIVTY